MIVDDSELACEELRYLLRSFTEVEVVSLAKNADEAEALLANTEVDLMFLDIQMPGRDGFELLQSLEKCPQVIFTTAYDQYAIRAFEFNAIDYLLKPINPQRLAKSLANIISNTSNNTNTQEAKLSMEDQVFVKDGDQCWFVKLTDIRVFETEGSYTRILFNDDSALITKSLNYLEKRLDPKFFFRANRSQIINIQNIGNIVVDVSGLQVVLSCGREIQLTRRQAQLFKSMKSF